LTGLDEDLARDGAGDLLYKLLELRRAVRKVVTARGDGLCWRDAYTELAGLLPERPPVDVTPPREVFLANCARFEESMRSGGGYTAARCPLGRECPLNGGAP
jgi:hypothetical protein